MLSMLEQFMVIGAGASAIMLALWVVQRAINDAGVVDVGWAACLGTAGLVAALTGPGDDGRRLILGLCAGLWGYRLALHLLTDRVLFAAHEDGRYLELREKFGAKVQPFFFVFFQAQALSVPLLATPFVLASRDTSAGLAWYDVGGMLLWATGVIGESVADRQLKAFKKRPSSKGKTCREGLWRYSRHPNYFFEWLVWCSYALLASGAPWGWLAWSAPATMLFLVLKVTGIPPTEKRALRSRGEDYREYQRTTSAFVPWFPKGAQA